MNFPQGFVHHAPRHLWKPKISSREDAEHSRHPHPHVEMANHEVSPMEHDGDRGLSQEKTAHAAADEHRNKTQCKKGRRIEAKVETIQTEYQNKHKKGGG